MTLLKRPQDRSATVKDFVEAALSGKLGVPGFQRPYIWAHKKREALFQSILKGEPVGAVLLWKAPRSVDARQLCTDLRQATAESVEILLVDGQQRVTTLTQQQWLASMWTEGAETSPWAAVDARRIKTYSIRFADGLLEPRLSSLIPKKVMSLRPSNGWIPLPALLHSHYDVLVSGVSARHRGTLDSLRERVCGRRLVYDLLPDRATPKVALRAFKAINTAGTRLKASDIAAADLYDAVPSLYGEIADFTQKLRACDGRSDRFEVFQQNLLHYALLYRLTGSASPAALQRKAKDGKLPAVSRIKGEWKCVKAGFTQVKALLRNELSLGDDGGVQGFYLITAAQALISHQSRADRARIARWLVLALLRRPYTGGSTFKNLNADLDAVSARRIKWSLLYGAMHKQSRGRQDARLTAEDFAQCPNGLSRKSFLVSMVWICAKRDGAVDWRSGASLPSYFTTDDELSRCERHHIFPRAFLRENGTAAEREVTHRIGNLAFLSKKTNVHFDDEDPREYLHALRKEVGSPKLDARLARHAVSTRAEDWRNAVRFVERREQLLAARINQMLGRWGRGLW